MNFDFYLSEMWVSDRHGGGLTLQRILGTDLDRIDCFVQPAPFRRANPGDNLFESRSLQLPGWERSEMVRTLLRRLTCNRLYQTNVLTRVHARKLAAQLSKRFRDKPIIRGLVCPQGLASLYCLDALSGFSEIEYATWFMDDHLVRWDGSKWSYRKGVEELLRRHLSRARAIFTISPAMQSFFSSRFGVESEVLFGPAEAPGNPVWRRPNPDKTVRLGYFGGLHPWQTDALRIVAERVEALDAVLDIYSASQWHPSFLKHPGVAFRGPLAPQEVRATMPSYDAVVLPVSFEPRSRHLSEFNIATKMSDCLSSGTLTLLFAPPYAVMSRILQAEKAAVVVSENSLAALQDAIGRIRAGTGRAEILRAATRYVERALSPQAMRRVWKRGLSDREIPILPTG
jgi:hypothetical protein